MDDFLIIVGKVNSITQTREFRLIMGYEMQIELDYKKKWDKIIKIVWRKVISLKISKFYADRDEPEITVMPKEDLVKFEAFLQEI